MKFSIEVNNIYKAYSGFKLDDVSFKVPKGSIMGLIGENGAGKSTIINAILNIISVDSGCIKIDGKKFKGNEKYINEEIGVVLDENSFHENLKASEISKIMNLIYKNWDKESFNRYLKRLNVPLEKKVKELSKGMKMKLSIAVALSHKPKILILDEGTTGLDPIVRDDILDILMEFIQNDENSILMSSHITMDLEKIADYITFIHNGKVIFTKSKDKLIYTMGVAKCGEDDFKNINNDYYTYYRKNAFNYEILIEDKEKFLIKYPNIVIDNIRIDDIMLFYIKGEK